MKLFNSIKKHARRLSLGVVAAVALTTVGLAAAGTNSVAYAAGNDISTGNSGTTCRDLVNKIKGSKELQIIYADGNFGLTSARYEDFASHCKRGIATKDNKIVVNGKTYATNVGSIGRFKSYQGSNPRTFDMRSKGAGIYYGNLNSKAFASGTSAIPVDVLLNSDGSLQFAVMTTTCGNPVYFQHQTPKYACDELVVKKVGVNTYQFTTNVSNSGGAVVDHVEYNLGDGPFTRQSPSQVVTHTFKENKTVSVRVFFKLPDGRVVATTVGGDCLKHITYVPPAPIVACNLLTLDQGVVDQTNGATTHILTATASATNATIKSYTFNFGDGKFQTVATGATSAKTAAHVYPVGTYSAKVLVTFVTNTGKVVTAGNTGKCVVSVPVKPLPTNLVCNTLTLTKGAVDPATGNTVITLNASASATRATITSYRFHFGDSAADQVVTTNATTASSAAHSYAPGTYSAKVFVSGKDVYGKEFKDVTDPYCAKSFTVTPPAGQLACVSLTATPGAIDTTGAQTYSLTATATKANATITSYDFTYGDGQTKNVPSSDLTASTTHVYAPRTDSYIASVTVNGKDLSGKAIQATSDSCRVTFKVKIPECKPGVPVGSPQCSTLACVSLSLVPGAKNDDGSQAYTLNAVASADQATINSYVFSFGDGSDDQTVTSNLTTASTTHTYAPSTATQTATVTVFGKDVTGATIHDTNAACSKPVTNTPQTPGITITKLVNGVKAIQTNTGVQFTYTLKVTNTGEKALNAVVVTDTPEAGVSLDAQQALGTVTDNTWTYTIPTPLGVGQSMSFELTATVPTYQAGTIVNTACVNAPEVNPEHPDQNDSCDTANVSVSQPPQVLPAVLPNTGAGSVIGIFGASAVIGTIGYRLFLSRKLNRQ